MKEALTIVAITIGIISYVPYFIGIFKKPLNLIHLRGLFGQHSPGLLSLLSC